MFCTQCGSEIKDGFKFCPECGNAVVQNTPSDNRSEIDRIADEIFWKQPVSRGKAKELARIGGISYDEAYDMISERFQSYKKGKKLGKYPDTQYCPCCASQDIEPYEEPGITVTSKANVFGGMYITSSNPSTTWMRCKRCGNRWKPKKR